MYVAIPKHCTCIFKTCDTILSCWVDFNFWNSNSKCGWHGKQVCVHDRCGNVNTVYWEFMAIPEMAIYNVLPAKLCIFQFFWYSYIFLVKGKLCISHCHGCCKLETWERKDKKEKTKRKNEGKWGILLSITTCSNHHYHDYAICSQDT